MSWSPPAARKVVGRSRRTQAMCQTADLVRSRHRAVRTTDIPDRRKLSRKVTGGFRESNWPELKFLRRVQAFGCTANCPSWVRADLRVALNLRIASFDRAATWKHVRHSHAAKRFGEQTSLNPADCGAAPDGTLMSRACDRSAREKVDDAALPYARQCLLHPCQRFEWSSFQHGATLVRRRM